MLVYHGPAFLSTEKILSSWSSLSSKGHEIMML